MGYNDNFPAVSTSWIAAFGREITYTPSDQYIDPFTCWMAFEKIVTDELTHRIVSDRMRAYVAQAALTEGGVDRPNELMDQQSGDAITLDGETWTIVEYPEYDHTSQIWELIVERNIRVVP